MRHILMAAALAACGGGDGQPPDLHTEAAPCPDGLHLTCESGCFEVLELTEPACADAFNPNNGRFIDCTIGTQVVDGVLGCCSTQPGDPVERFYECE